MGHRVGNKKKKSSSTGKRKALTERRTKKEMIDTTEKALLFKLHLFKSAFMLVKHTPKRICYVVKVPKKVTDDGGDDNL